MFFDTDVTDLIATFSLLTPLSLTAVAGQSAIERALESEKSPTKLDKELMDELNISRGSIDADAFVSFLERIRNNSQLETVLREAKEQGVRISVSFNSSARPGVVYINVEITDDDEIINHVARSISVALAKEQLRKELEQPAEEFGVTQGSIDIEEFALFIERVHSNPVLAEVLKEVRDAGIRIHITFRFSTRHRVISINVSKTDDEIIKFIRGT